MVLFVMMMSGVSLLTAMFTVYLDNQSEGRKIPQPLRFLCFNVLGRLFCLSGVSGTERVKPQEKPNLGPEEKLGVVSLDTCESKMDTAHQLHVIFNELRVITSFLRAQEESGAQQQEWKLLARVVDRLLFWMSLTACVVYFCTFLARAS